jgi:DnaJ-class molecular chaperone
MTLALGLLQAPHPTFTRSGDDLHHLAKIPLVRALSGCTLTLPTLDQREVVVGVNDVIHAGYEKVLAGEGMPSCEEPGKRGDLIISYQVDFPATLDETQRHLLKAALFLPKESAQTTEQKEALKTMKKVFPFE